MNLKPYQCTPSEIDRRWRTPKVFLNLNYPSKLGAPSFDFFYRRVGSSKANPPNRRAGGAPPSFSESEPLKTGCPILATYSFLSQGWDPTTLHSPSRRPLAPPQVVQKLTLRMRFQMDRGNYAESRSYPSRRRRAQNHPLDRHQKAAKKHSKFAFPANPPLS